MSQITVTKGKLLKGDKVEVEYISTLPGKKPKSCSEESDNTPRQSFKNAFDKLAVHAALRGEFISLKAVKDIKQPNPELIKDFTVTGFSISESKKMGEGVVLTGHKVLSDGKILGFNTPLIRFDDESENAYPHLELLSSAIKICQDECREYINENYAENPQQSLDLKEA